MTCSAAKTPTAQGTVPPKGHRHTVKKTALRNKNLDKENKIDSIKGFRRWGKNKQKNYDELKKHVLAQYKESKNLEDRLEELLT